MFQFDFKKLLFLGFLMTSVIGCSKRDPNPELRDPVYLDLKHTVGEIKTDVSSLKATVEDEYKNIKNAEPRSKDLALAKKRHIEAVHKLERAEQLLKYYEIKEERRRLEARVSYEKALAAEKEWPDPKEYKAYLAHKELVSANRQWSSRVPKLHDRVKEFNSPPKPKAAESGGGH